MKCALCKGKGFLYTEHTVGLFDEYDPYLGPGTYIGPEQCPRCNGTKKEKYISYKHRVKNTLTDYGKYYNRYFKDRYIETKNKETIENIFKDLMQ